METIVREKVTYGVVLFDKYILCDIKTYPASEIQFRKLDEIDKKKAKIRQYNSLKVLAKEAPHHFSQWAYWLPQIKEHVYLKDKIEPWWEPEIEKLKSILRAGGFTDNYSRLPIYAKGAWEYLIETKAIKIIKIKERLIFEE